MNDPEIHVRPGKRSQTKRVFHSRSMNDTGIWRRVSGWRRPPPGNLSLQLIVAHRVAAQQAAGLDNDPVGTTHRNIKATVEPDHPTLIDPRHALDR